MRESRSGHTGHDTRSAAGSANLPVYVKAVTVYTHTQTHTLGRQAGRHSRGFGLTNTVAVAVSPLEGPNPPPAGVALQSQCLHTLSVQPITSAQ